MSDTDVEVPLDETAADAEAVVETETPEAKTPEAKTISAEEGIDDLRKRLKAEQEARRQAEDRAREAQQAHHDAERRAVAAGQEADDTNLTLVNNAIGSLKREQEVTKGALRAAYAEQNWEAVADAQEAIATNAARLLQLENGKAEMERAPKRPEPNSATADPVEALAGQLAPRSAAWVRAHPEYARSRPQYMRMIAAHNLVTADGRVTPDTDAYFTAIETALGLQQGEDPTAQAAQATGGRQASAAPPAAPVSRSNTPVGRPNTVRLSAEEREMAAMMNMTDKQYAENKAALIQAGKLH